MIFQARPDIFRVMLWSIPIALAAIGSSDFYCPGAKDSGSPCRVVTGYAVLNPPEASSPWTLTVDCWSQDQNEDRSLKIWSSSQVFHEADPGTLLDHREAHAREVRTCVAHWPRRYCITGGMPPRDFVMLVASAMPRRPGRSMTAREALVTRGLSSDSYHTRQAAHDCLVRAGVAAIEPCLGGLKSADAEVRLRSQLILDEIRNGPFL